MKGHSAILQFKKFSFLMLMAVFSSLLSHKAEAQTQLFYEDFESPDSNWVFEQGGDSARWTVKSLGGIGNSRAMRCSRVTNASGGQASKYFAALPGLALTNGHHYTIRFKSRVTLSNARKMKLAWNTTPSRNGSMTLIHDFDTLTNDNYETFSTSFTASSTQTHYFILFGDNLLSHPDPVLWYIDEVEVFRNNQEPTVAITFPVNYQTYIEGPMTITAMASDPDGSIARVVFYVDEDSVGQDLTAPYSLTTYLHPKEEEGQKTYLYARAYDNAGAYEHTGINIDVLANTCDLERPETSRQIICSYDSVECRAIANNGGKKVQWQYWQANNWQENEFDTLAHCYKKPGIYRARITYSNGATCFTRVDTVSTLTIDVPMVYSYGGQPAFATVLASGGAEPYTFVWTGTDTCLNLNCDSVLITQFDSSVSVLVTDFLGCEISHNIDINYVNDCHSGNVAQSGEGSLSPEEAQKFEAAEKSFQNFILDMKRIESFTPESNLFKSKTLVIPVLFLVYRKSPGDFIETKFLANYQNQIDTLNSAFKNSKLSYGGTDYTIKFCLAKPANLSGFETGFKFITDQTLSEFPVGDPVGPEIQKRMVNFNQARFEKYYRIVVTGSAGAGAYAYSSNPTWTHYLIPDSNIQKREGTIIDIRCFGSQPETLARYSNYDNGKILVHEAGHWLNLHHPYVPFGERNQPFPGCLAKDYELNNQFVHWYTSTAGVLGWDLVKDTPPKKVPWGTCTDNINDQKCTGYNYEATPLERNNHMDNAPDNCRTKFTNGQIERMFYTLLYYKNQLVDPQTAIEANVDCKEPVALFEIEKNEACGTSGDDSKIKGSFYPNPTISGFTNIHHSWTYPTGVTIAESGNEFEISFNPSLMANKMANVELKVFWNEDTTGISVSKDVFYFGSCIADCQGSFRKNLIFGKGCKLAWQSLSPFYTNSDAAFAVKDSISVDAGTVTASDDLGNLLFYAGGSNLWNKNFKRVTSNSLSTDSNSTQFGTFFKSPNTSENQVYYLVTVPSLEFSGSNPGLRLHKLDVSVTGINASPTPNISTSIFNQAIPAKSGEPSTNGAAKVSDKIVHIPIQGQNGHWIIVQKMKPDSGDSYTPKFYVYKFLSGGLSDSIQMFDAYHHSQKGFIKTNPSGDKILATYTAYDSLNYFRYTGLGNSTANPRIFNFNRATGAITLFRILKISGVDSGYSSYGGSFSKNGRYVYVNVNQLKETGNITGLYRFDLNATPTNGNVITGTKISDVLPGNMHSFQLALDNGGRILASTPPSQGLQMGAYLNPPFGSMKLGVVQFPDDSINAGFTWEGPKLVDSQAKYIRSKMGLPNFSDFYIAIENSYTEPKDLGTNPKPCCGHHTEFQNVSCTGNNNSINGNDFYYTFTVDSICGTDYPGVVIKTCGSDFPVKMKIWLKAPGGGWSPDTLKAPQHFSVSNCPTGNGQVFVLEELNITNFLPGDFKRPFEFLVEVEAQNPSASGEFKTEIQIQEDYEYFDGFGIVACELPVSCCRIALNDGNKGPSDERKQFNQKADIKLIPNPAKDKVNIQLEGLEPDAILNITDALGRDVLQVRAAHQTELDVRSLSKGIYRVRARDNLSTVFKTLIVE